MQEWQEDAFILIIEKVNFSCRVNTIYKQKCNVKTLILLIFSLKIYYNFRYSEIF